MLKFITQTEPIDRILIGKKGWTKDLQGPTHRMVRSNGILLILNFFIILKNYSMCSILENKFSRSSM